MPSCESGRRVRVATAMIATAVNTLLLLRPSSRCSAPVAKIPPIKSDVFVPLGSPSNYSALLDNAAPDTVSVIKFQAGYCRTCRASSPLLDRVAKQYPDANYFSMDLYRDGKAAGERMNRFFKEKKVKLMPYVEIYVGNEMIDTEVVPPSALASFEQAIGSALERLQVASSSRGGAGRQLVLLRQFLREKQRELGYGGSKRKGRRRANADDEEAGAQPPKALSFLEEKAAPWLQRGGGHQSPQNLPPGAKTKKRGAPLRGATGGRRKGWR